MNRFLKMKYMYLAFSFFVVVLLDRTLHTDAHGYLADPPMRSFLYIAHPGNNFASSSTYRSLFCGGTSYQWDTHNGKCGVCGDPYGADVKPNEDIGGKYVTNFIAGRYTEGSVMTIKVHLTAKHKGWFEFRLCPLEYVGALVTQACLDEHLLKFAKDDTTRYPITESMASVHVTAENYYHIQLQLPDGLTCEQCVLQWWYKTGNNWGCNPERGCCTGCGDKQETFVNCADISIVPAGSSQQSTETDTPYGQDEDGLPYPGIDLVPDTEVWETEPPTNPPDAQTSPPPVTNKVKTTTLPPAETTTTPPNLSELGAPIVCYSVGIWESPAFDIWCTKNCLHVPSYCPKGFCECEMA